MSMCSLSVLFLLSVVLIGQAWARKRHQCSVYSEALLPSRHCWGPNGSILTQIDVPEVPSLLMDYAAMHKAVLDGNGRRAAARGLLIWDELDDGVFVTAGIGNLFHVYQSLVLIAIWVRKALLLRTRRPLREFFYSPLGITWDYEEALQQSSWLRNLKLDLDKWDRGGELPMDLFRSEDLFLWLKTMPRIEVISHKNTPVLLEALHEMANHENQSFSRMFEQLASTQSDLSASDVNVMDRDGFSSHIRIFLQRAVFGGWTQQCVESVAGLIREAAGGDSTWMPDSLKIIGVHLRTGQTEEADLREAAEMCQRIGDHASSWCECLQRGKWSVQEIENNPICVPIWVRLVYGPFRTRMIKMHLAHMWGAIIKLKRAVSRRMSKQFKQQGPQQPLWLVFVGSNDIAMMDKCAKTLNSLGEPRLRAVSLARSAEISNVSFNTPFSGFREVAEDWALMTASDYIIRGHNISTFSIHAALHGSKHKEHLVSHDNFVYSFLKVPEKMQTVFDTQIRGRINKALMASHMSATPLGSKLRSRSH